MPRGFPADSPAVEFLKQRQFLASREFPADFATDAKFYPTLVSTFAAMMPLIRFLNEPLTGISRLSADARRDHDDGLQASLLLLALVLRGLQSAAQQSPAPTPAAVQARNLVLITIDTLRADRVGAYGYARARTPHIDALAARGVRFEHAFATAPITLPSHASLMTGRYPPGHGSRHNGIKVDAAVPTLAKALSPPALRQAHSSARSRSIGASG